MSKKHESPAQPAAEPADANQQAPDAGQAHTGKVAHQRNKAAATGAATQIHQDQRSPESRNDREAHLGGHNQTESRTGGHGTGRGPRGAG